MGKKGGFAFGHEMTRRDVEAKDEKGGDNHHYQCYLHVTEKRRPRTLGGQLGREYPGIRVVPVSINGLENFKKYVVKADHTLVAGPWTSKTEMKSPYDMTVQPTAQRWQAEVYQIFKSEPPRRGYVNWIYNQAGHAGKTELARKLIESGLGLPLGFDNVNNLRNMVVNQGKQNGYFFDFPRTKSKEHDMDAIYSFLEELGGGIILNGKFHARNLVMRPPHVWVLSNYLPKKDRLTGDRFKIYSIHDSTRDLIHPKWKPDMFADVKRNIEASLMPWDGPLHARKEWDPDVECQWPEDS